MFVIVWAGMVGSTLLGSYILPPRLNSAYYTEFLDMRLNEFVEVQLAQRNTIYFQQYGCCDHLAKIVTEFLKLKFPKLWWGELGLTK